MKNNGKDPHIVLTDERILLLRGVGFKFGETIAKESRTSTCCTAMFHGSIPIKSQRLLLPPLQIQIQT